MKTPVNIIIPMAGLGSRFTEAGYTKPKPFIDIMGQSMIERVLRNLNYPHARYILLVRTEHLVSERAPLRRLSKEFDIQIVPIDKTTEGAACTALYARSLINNDTPLMFANSDQIIDIEISGYLNDCRERKLDGSIMTFNDPTRNPKWSFARLNKQKIVVTIAEKKPISSIATVGIYLYTKGRYFVDSAIDMIAHNDRVNNEFYVAPTYNYAIRNKLKIGIYMLPFSAMHGLGTPDDMNSYIKLLKGSS